MSDTGARVAVITGAASGIGRGLAEYAASQGLRLVLGDIDAACLATVAEMLSERGAEVAWQLTDVSQPQHLETLRDLAVQRFGGVDLLFNNAGIMQTGLCWEVDAAKWQRMLDVNLNGVLNGIRSFMPLLLQQKRPAHVFNTASLAGLINSPLLGPYNVTKQAVVAISETLHYELAMLDAPIIVSVLCPGPVASSIMESNSRIGDADARLDTLLGSRVRKGMRPLQLAQQVFAAIDEQRFWIFPHKFFKPALQRRLQSILDETNPVLQIAQE